mmetsp:Transcript_24572/g.79013  ORF Transcript_24572/g.79013 Transcript_24572/m.79013 type:complete len:324 (+) Transcript_24572:56-1027(+)
MRVIILLVVASTTVGRAPPPPSAAGSLARALARSALDAWADGGAAGGSADIEWDSRLGRALLSLLRLLVSPAVRVAAEMAETMLPPGELVQGERLYAPARLAHADLNASELRVTGLRSLGELTFTPVGARAVRAAADFETVNASMLVEALLTPLGLPGASVGTAGRLSASLEGVRLAVTFSVPPVSRRVALQALSLSGKEEGGGEEEAPPQAGPPAAECTAASEAGGGAAAEGAAAAVAAVDYRAKAKARKAASPLRLGVTAVEVRVGHVTAAVLDPEDEIGPPGLLWRTLSSAFSEQLRGLVELHLSQVLRESLDELVRVAR